MNRFTRKLVSLLGIVAVIFAQLAASAYACPLQVVGLDEAGAVVGAPMVGAPEANSSGRDPKSPALCQKHCENGQQSVSDTPQPLAFFTLESAFVITIAMDAAAPLPATALAPSLLRTTSPPLSIRHCCFRI